MVGMIQLRRRRRSMFKHGRRHHVQSLSPGRYHVNNNDNNIIISTRRQTSSYSKLCFGLRLQPFPTVELCLMNLSVHMRYLHT